MLKFMNWVALQEGGHALTAPTIPINQENAVATLNSVKKKLESIFGINDAGFSPIGSSGKKMPGQTSGDLDVAISLQQVIDHLKIPTTLLNDQKKLMAYLRAILLGHFGEARIIGSTIVSVPFPIENIDGLQPKGVVQCDIMFVNNIKVAQFGFHSPHALDSAYKGVYRNTLLFCIAKEHSTAVVETQADGTTIVSRYFMDQSNGLMYGLQKITPKGTKKAIEKKVVETDPDKIVKTLLGPNFTVKDADSFESLFRVINSSAFVGKANRAKILHDAKASLENQNFPIPWELDHLT